MASFGSSTINKSGKRFAPKAVPRRPPTTSQQSPHPTSRAGTERRSISVTPAPSSEPNTQGVEGTVSQADTPRHAASNAASSNQNIDQEATTARSRQALDASSLANEPSRLDNEQRNVPRQDTRSRETVHAQLRSLGTSAGLVNAGSGSVEPPLKRRKVADKGVQAADTARQLRSTQTDTVPTGQGDATGQQGLSYVESTASTNNEEEMTANRNAGDVANATSTLQVMGTIEGNNVNSSAKSIRKTTRTSKKATKTNGQQGDNTERATKEGPKRKTRAKGKQRTPGQSRFRVSRQPASDPQATQSEPGPSVMENEQDEGTAVERPPRKRKKRARTPENAEQTEVATSIVTMAELTKDLRIGKKSKLAEELEKLDWSEIVRKQKERRARQEAGELPEQESVDEMLTRVGQEADAASQANHGPQMRLVNGQLVVDDTSLRVDRHAMASAGQDQMEAIEESELTRRVNSGSWLKREKSEAWSKLELELFYQGLRMFGTDFEIISKMFSRRTRRQVKLRYTKEERENPLDVRKALSGVTTEMDMDKYAQYTKKEYADPALLEADLERRRQEHDEEQQRIEAERAEEARKKREANDRTPEPVRERTPNIEHQNENDVEPSGDLQARKGRKGKNTNPPKRGRKAMHSLRVAGEAEVLGTI